MHVGSTGYSLPSSINGIEVVFLSFGTQHLNPQGTNGRGRGFQLRCLSE
ncbi:hypothetical protein [uncultured Rikenella sp.]|nr:hypothetical protein [uncultured Rikenella sp.]